MNSDGAGGGGVLCGFGSTRVVMVVVLMLVFGVVCDVGVVLVWCWCSGVVVGGAVVVWWWWWRWRPIKPQETHFSLEGGNCCPNFDSTLVVFYMLTTLYQLTQTLCHIYSYNHSQSCSVSSSSNLSPSSLSEV